MNRIDIRDLTFYYSKDEPILTNLQMTLDGRSTAIIGQNGAGKTTFVKLLKGLLKPISGSIVVNGLPVTEMTAAGLAPHIGLVFQNPNDQIFKNRVMDEVMFGPKCIGLSEDAAQEAATQALKMVGLLPQAEQNPYDLSLSERKLVSIASIVAMGPPIILLDEPTIAQDFLGKQRIKQLIETLKSQGKLVIAILHDMDFVAETFERTIVFSKGQVILDDATPSVFANERILKANFLELPHVMQAARKLGVNEVCTDVEDLIQVLKERSKKK